MEPFGLTFCAELETDRRIGADFAHGAPQGKEFLCIKEHARLIDKSLGKPGSAQDCRGTDTQFFQLRKGAARDAKVRSEEHTSELQSRLHLVCRLLLEKKKNTKF